MPIGPSSSGTDLTSVESTLSDIDANIVGLTTDLTTVSNNLSDMWTDLLDISYGGYTTEGTLSYLDAGGEQTVVEIIPSAGERRVVHGAWLDMTNITQNGTIKVYYKIDGTNYRLVDSSTFTPATDSDGVFINLNMGITKSFKITYTESSDEGAARNIPYQVIQSNIQNI